jgi:hypothetical protein
VRLSLAESWHSEALLMSLGIRNRRTGSLSTESENRHPATDGSNPTSIKERKKGKTNPIWTEYFYAIIFGCLISNRISYLLCIYVFCYAQDNNGTIENEELRGFLKDLLELVKKVKLLNNNFSLGSFAQPSPLLVIIAQ